MLYSIVVWIISTGSIGNNIRSELLPSSSRAVHDTFSTVTVNLPALGTNYHFELNSCYDQQLEISASFIHQMKKVSDNMTHNHTLRIQINSYLFGYIYLQLHYVSLGILNSYDISNYHLKFHIHSLSNSLPPFCHLQMQYIYIYIINVENSAH